MANDNLILGLSIQSGKRVTNERGFLQEITRDDDPSFFAIGQAYTTCTRRGIVRAWYKHTIQYDGIFLLAGKMKIVLVDGREGSESYQRINEFTLDERDPKLLRIPPGVWHGFQALEGDLLLLHLNSHPFRFDQPDEVRLNPTSDLIPYQWRL